MVRLAELVFIEAIRANVSAPGGPKLGLAAALRDPRIATAVVSIHRQPDLKWDVRRLARLAVMSRAAFVGRFKALVGESPMLYVTRCRMNRAVALLASDQMPLSRIAAQAGYESEASFGRAFKRHMGISPAAYRRMRLTSDD